MSKKLIALVIAALMILTAIPSLAEADAPTLKVYMFNGEMTDSALVQEAISKVVFEKIGCKIEFVWAGSDGYFSGLAMALASDEQMDVVFDHAGSGWYDRAKMGAYADMTELLELTPTLKASLPEYIWDAAKCYGKIVMVPTYKDLAMEDGVFVDAADLADSGIDVESIQSWGDLEPLCEYLVEKGSSIIVYAAGASSQGTGFTNMDRLTNFYDIYGEKYVSRKDDPATIINYYMTDEYEANVRLLYDWAQKGYIPADAATRDDSSYNVSGTGANYGIRMCQYMPLSEISLSEGYGAEVAYVPITEAVVSTDTLAAVGFFIPEKSQYKEYAMKFIELISCDHEVADIMNYGVEGVHFNYDETGDVVRVDNYTSLYSPAQFALGDIRGRSALPTEPDNKVEEYEKWNSKAVESPYIGLRLEMDEVEAYEANVNAVLDEYKVLFDVGALNPDEYLPAFREALIAAGDEKIIECIQQQYEDWADNK